MATTQAILREWLIEGLKEQATHMVVVCDTYDWEDYPVYVRYGHRLRQGRRSGGVDRRKLIDGAIYGPIGRVDRSKGDHPPWL